MPRTHAAELTGKRFGRLRAIRETDSRLAGYHVVWECVCKCGVYCYVAASNLRSGNTQSCGCLQRDRSKVPNSRRKKSV